MLSQHRLLCRRPIRCAANGGNRLKLTSNLQVMIFGSSTGVGKSIVSAGVCRAALSRERKVCYIKPLQTGELDEYFVNFYTNPQGINDIFLRTLHHWSSSMPPHLAAAAEAAGTPISDKDLILGLEREMRAFSNSATSPGKPDPLLFSVVETAGGVLSPGPSRNLQADIYRTFRFPIILVGDSKLGGITTTLSAYESLRLRGYTVHAIVMIEHPGTNKYGNVLMIREHLERSLSFSSDINSRKHGVEAATPPWEVNNVPKVFRMLPLPSDKLLHNWFRENSDRFGALFDHIERAVGDEKKRLMAMRKNGQDIVWWPSTQHASVDDGNVTFIESAHGDKFRVLSPAPTPAPFPLIEEMTSENQGEQSVESKVVVNDLFDGCASWWTQGVGHGNPSMSLALAEAAGRYGHVMFPSNLHPPAVQLAQYLLEKGPGRNWAQRVFYSDDGTTGMEVAIKMALRLWDVRMKKRDLEGTPGRSAESYGSDDIGGYMGNIVVLTQRDCHHGDTLGTMDTGEIGPSKESQHPWYRPRTRALPLPLLAYRNGKLSIDTSDLQSPCKIGCTPDSCPCADVVRAAASSCAPASSSSTSTSTSYAGQWPSIESIMNVESRAGSDLQAAYRAFIKAYLSGCDVSNVQIGALLLEPLMIGAGGMKFIDPLYQKVLVQECRARGIPIVYDEVAVGMYRLGPSSTSSILGEYPDIAVYGKMLSGGYLPLAATLATSETFNAFLGKKKWHALLHGHSFTANPISCAACLESARLLEGGADNTWFDPQAYGGLGGMRNSFSESDIRDVSFLPGVKGVMSLGSVLSVELSTAPSKRTAGHAFGRHHKEFPNSVENIMNDFDCDTSLGNKLFTSTSTSEEISSIPSFPSSSSSSDDTSASESASDENKNARYYNNNASAIVVALLKQNNVYARPLGNIVYLMPTPMTPEADRQRLIRVIKRCITKAFYLREIPSDGSKVSEPDEEAGFGTIV